MKPIIYLTRSQMRELDRLAIEKYRIPALILMENAGRAVAQEALKMVKPPARISVICGKGNNGGDGFVAARHLFNQGLKVYVFYLGHIMEAIDQGEAGINLRIIYEMGVPIKEISQVEPILPYLKKSDLIIDAIFGVGLERPIEGDLRVLIEKINQLNKPIIAIDVPSGLDCNKGIPLGVAIKASQTITLGAAKIGFKKPTAKKYLGKLTVADIGIPRFLFK